MALAAVVALVALAGFDALAGFVVVALLVALVDFAGFLAGSSAELTAASVEVFFVGFRGVDVRRLRVAGFLGVSGDSEVGSLPGSCPSAAFFVAMVGLLSWRRDASGRPRRCSRRSSEVESHTRRAAKQDRM
jgi:hypothetical protein